MRDLQLRISNPEDGDASEGFLQSGFWGRFKSEFGWRAQHFRLSVGSQECPLLVLERGLARGFSFAYVPHGPEAQFAMADGGEFLSHLAAALRPQLQKSCVFVRFDPPWYAGSDREADAPPRLGRPLRKASADVQPPDTVLLDLAPDEERLLAQMKPKWRYNIRLAAKKGVRVESCGVESLPDFYRLYRQTAERDRISLHPERYYARLFALAAEYAAGDRERAQLPDLRLWLARHDGDILAGIITLFWGERAVYLYGASSDLKRSLMPAYALQWSAITAAKGAGCREYDFFGIPPTEDPQHPMAGLYRFKTGFGGRIVHRSGAWDYALRPQLYRAFRAAEAARMWWFKDLRKRRASRSAAAGTSD